MTSTAPLTALETATSWLAHASWQAALLGLLVFVVAWALRGRLEARWRYGLWLVVLARLALPITPPAPWSLFRLVPSAFPKPAMSSSEGTPLAGPAPTTYDREATGEGVNEMAPAAFSTSQSSQEESTATLGTTPQWLGVAWLTGVLVLLVRRGWLHMQLHCQRRTGREVSDPFVQNVFRDCRQELGVVRPVGLLIAKGRFGPGTCGAFRATIFLPEKLLSLLSPGELRLVLLHELTHVRRWDVLLDRMAALLVALHWFNPVAWLVLACLRRERELACDAAVLRHLGEQESVRYGHALLKVAEQLSASAPLPGAVGVYCKDRSLVRRIHMIAHYRKPTAAAKALGALLLLLMAAFGLTDALAEPPPKGGTDQAPPPATGGNAKTSTIGGVCNDEEGKPLAGVKVALYRQDYRDRAVERLRTEETGDDGGFHFRELPPLPPREAPLTWCYGLVVTKQGRGSIIQYLFYEGFLKNPLQFKLRPAATLQGRVTDANGKPIAGAQVWAQGLVNGPVEGVAGTRTDADGHYAITDMSAWGEAELKPRPIGKNLSIELAGCYFDVLHPGYGNERPMYRSMPATVDVVLQPEGIIEGKAVDQVTGKPAAGVMVSMQGTNATGGWQQMRTDASGKYRLSSIVAGKYNLWAEAPDRTCTALDSFAVEAGKTHAAPDLLLIEGGWLEGQLIEADTGKPISGKWSGGRMNIGLYGPSRPRSGGGIQSSPVDDEGRFRLRVAPGVNFPYLMHGDYWQRTEGRADFEKGVEVKSGEVVRVVFRIQPPKPIPPP
jgi:beta-lactamase regulating signal transducer with metallopeptidase domain/5-hydroxyisourate hydrolase-like protein (transthyretin family)